MTDKQKNTENEAQIIKNEDLARHNSRGIYMRDDHCDWGSSGMKDLVETLNESNQIKFYFFILILTSEEHNNYECRKYLIRTKKIYRH